MIFLTKRFLEFFFEKFATRALVHFELGVGVGIEVLNQATAHLGSENQTNIESFWQMETVKTLRRKYDDRDP